MLGPPAIQRLRAGPDNPDYSDALDQVLHHYRLQLFLHAPPCPAQPIAVERQEQGGQAAHFRETDDSGLQISCALCHTFRAELSQERRRLLRTIVHVFVCFQVRVITGRSVFSGGG